MQQITNTLMNFLLNCHVLIAVSLPQSVTIWLFVLKKWKLCKGYIITLTKHTNLKRIKIAIQNIHKTDIGQIIDTW